MDADRQARTLLVWDLPTRLFHWAMGLAVAGAFSVALLTKGSSTLFPVHMLLGSLAAVMVLLRLVWGFAGSRYARFSSFAFGPRKVVEYFRGLWKRDGERWVGHNPGSSVAIFGMLFLLLATAVTGALAGTVGGLVKELHPVLAYTLLGVVGAHVLGVVIHLVRHRENIVGAMVDGKKAPTTAPARSPAIESSHPIAAIVFVALVATWGVGVSMSYDAKSRSVVLPFGGTKIVLQPKRKARPQASHLDTTARVHVL